MIDDSVVKSVKIIKADVVLGEVVSGFSDRSSKVGAELVKASVKLLSEMFVVIISVLRVLEASLVVSLVWLIYGSGTCTELNVISEIFDTKVEI